MRILSLSAAFIGLALPALADDAALLIGVDRYETLSRSSNGTDLLAADDALRDAGYQVSTVSNGSGRDTHRQLEQFATNAEDADRLVVGLSGRFVTDGNRTWLMAADAARPALFTLGDAISVDSVLQVLAATPGQAVMVLGVNTTEDDDLDRYLREGLGNLDIPQGVTVVIGRAQYADDFLEDAVATPGANVMGFVRDTRRLRAEGYQPDGLIMQARQAPRVDTNPAPQPRPVTDPTLAPWQAAQDRNTADSYRDFLFQYPGSPYATEARRRLDAIENDPVRIDRLAEEALNLNRAARRAIQRNLTVLNYNTRGVDGIFGPGSRRAIRNWQQSNGFTQTSYLTAEQITRLDGQASRRRAEIEAEQERERARAEQLDRAYWEETGARGDEAGFRAYLDRYPEGLFAERAKEGLSRFDNRNDERDRSRDDRNEAREKERALNINPVLGRLIESRLQQLGFDPGRVDGRFDRDTRSAIGRYQTRSSIAATGYLNEPTLARLLADTFGR